MTVAVPTPRPTFLSILPGHQRCSCNHRPCIWGRRSGPGPRGETARTEVDRAQCGAHELATACGLCPLTLSLSQEDSNAGPSPQGLPFRSLSLDGHEITRSASGQQRRQRHTCTHVGRVGPHIPISPCTSLQVMARILFLSLIPRPWSHFGCP